MKKEEVCDVIKKVGIIPAIRVSSGDDAHFAAESVTQGGIPIVEITMTVPGAVELIAHLVRYHPQMIVGAGTVCDTETARKCVGAGASFLTAPGFDSAIVEFAAKENITVLPGALTPTEVLAAWRAGSDFVKVFPCALVGGDKYIKALKASFTQIPLIAAGGFILSGASAIGVGKELIPTESIECRQSERIRELALRFSRLVKDARDQIEEWKRTFVPQNFVGGDNCAKP
jgi:2-dehydro-3-deoxyphosphogluconate aldolase/(4S)-4-hydroxy-2-oxoglutarate aldolase